MEQGQAFEYYKGDSILDNGERLQHTIPLQLFDLCKT